MEDLRKTFSTITDRMENVRKVVGGADGDAVGAEKLVGEVHDFADEWKYGITRIGETTAATVEMIDEIATKFDALDKDLMETLTKAEGG
ncbi:hypothetical protein [Streptomyces sp. MAR4 CNX-425]|uniref:hypothetical protein n=1 Tax=Streptomyces sp. MAR4 CNX-425 TaxID=3406343 RepID=UPI003B50AEFE